MGYYVQTGTTHRKAERIAHEHGGHIVRKPRQFSDIPEDKALICVVDNGPFEAAALAYDEREFDAFTEPDDDRPKQFVLLDKNVAYGLAGYTPEVP